MAESAKSREQRAEIRRLRDENIRFKAALIGIYKQAHHLPGRGAVEALIEAGQLKEEDLRV